LKTQLAEHARHVGSLDDWELAQVLNFDVMQTNEFLLMELLPLNVEAETNASFRCRTSFRD
jgi:hypothetical protein